jgi:hypothetical protein
MLQAALEHLPLLAQSRPSLLPHCAELARAVLSSPNWSERALAVRALGAMGQEHGSIVQATHDPSGFVRSAASEARKRR